MNHLLLYVQGNATLFVVCGTVYQHITIVTYTAVSSESAVPFLLLPSIAGVLPRLLSRYHPVEVCKVNFQMFFHPTFITKLIFG